jgi:hypothetical protein
LTSSVRIGANRQGGPPGPKVQKEALLCHLTFVRVQNGIDLSLNFMLAPEEQRLKVGFGMEKAVSIY